MSAPYTEAWLAGPRKTSFYTRTYLPRSVPLRAAIVFVHGLGEHIGRYGHFHPRLAENGIAVFAYDQRGFGRTAQDDGHKSNGSSIGKTSWSNQMDDISWALHHVTSQYDSVPLFLMGHSMGGGEALGFASLAGNRGAHSTILSRTKGVIATSPLVHLKKPFPNILLEVAKIVAYIAPCIPVPLGINKEALSHDKSVGEDYAKDPLVTSISTLKQVTDALSEGNLLLTQSYRGWPTKLPLLVIHGSEDDITSFKASQTFVNQVEAGSKNFVAFPGGYHELHNEQKEVAEQLLSYVVSFVDRCLDNIRT